MKKAIELVHFQLTKDCNLRCWFCGQWGHKGFFSDRVGEAMTLKDWIDVLEQLEEYGNEIGALPHIMLWGGEPLVYPNFREIVAEARKRGFELGIVTNGTKIEKYADLLKNEFRHIYVSIDGTRDIHDKIRGEGVFDKVSENLELLRGTKATITIMSVISEDNADILEEMADALLMLNCDEIILQDMIALTSAEAAEYKAVMKKIGITAEHIDSWIMDTPKIETDTKTVCNKYPDKVRHIPHGEGDHCKSPFSHIHIAWNGNVIFCTDFYDFSAGNVKNEKVLDIFNSEKAEQYRKIIEKDKCPTCRHCSWRKSDSFKL